MGDVLNQPFRSESYDRLIRAQAAHKAASAILDERTPAHIGALISEAITDMRAARAKLGLSQSQLAERLGTDGPRISAWENGKPMPAYMDLALRCLLAVEACK